MIHLTDPQLAQIRAHGETDYPHECCGLLIGEFAAGIGKVVRQIYPISNAREEAAKRNRFLITPQEFLDGERYALSRQLEVLGFYHSHPDHPAVPSGYDLEHAWPLYSYIIVAVAQAVSKELTSWELRDDRSHFDPETIQRKEV